MFMAFGCNYASSEVDLKCSNTIFSVELLCASYILFEWVQSINEFKLLSKSNKSTLDVSDNHVIPAANTSKKIRYSQILSI